MNGLDVLRALRQSAGSDAGLVLPPVLLMATAYSQDDVLAQSRGLQVVGFLQKPVSPGTLLDSLHNVFGSTGAKRLRMRPQVGDYTDAQNSLRGAYVLLVDDNAINQEVSVDILQGAGMRVDVANNGAEALQKVNQADYDAVLMDCQMPVMDGFEATRRIRQGDGLNEPHPTLAILAMTANAMAGEKEKCIAAGMNDHIAKPIDVAQLFKTLAHWVVPKNPSLQPHDPVPEPVGTPLASDALPPIAGIVMEGALRRVGGNAKLLRKLVNRFNETQADAVQRIQAALDGNDRTGAVRDAHTLKGLAGNIGATRIAELAGEAEAMIGRNEPAALHEVLGTLQHELQCLLQQITQAMAPAGYDAESAGLVATPGAAVDLEQLGKDLQELAALMAQDNFLASKSMANVAAKLVAAGKEHSAIEISMQVAEYDYEEALKTLTASAQSLGITL